MPISNNSPSKNAIAMEKVKNDKVTEAELAGHDGTWVAHPGLVSLARDIFNEHMPSSNQISKETSYDISENDLLVPPIGKITQAGLEQNIDVGIQYVLAWISGNGCVPLYNLMEDAATAEISRTQVWQWIKHSARIQDGTQIDARLVDSLIDQWRDQQCETSEQLDVAVEIFRSLSTSDTLAEFLTLPTYQYLINKKD